MTIYVLFEQSIQTTREGPRLSPWTPIAAYGDYSAADTNLNFRRAENAKQVLDFADFYPLKKFGLLELETGDQVPK